MREMKADAKPVEVVRVTMTDAGRTQTAVDALGKSEMSKELASPSRVGILVASTLSGIIGAAAPSAHNQFKEFCLGQ
jgi:hypothetical protein